MQAGFLKAKVAVFSNRIPGGRKPEKNRGIDGEPETLREGLKG
jgi:hypothetical protein